MKLVIISEKKDNYKNVFYAIVTFQTPETAIACYEDKHSWRKSSDHRNARHRRKVIKTQTIRHNRQTTRMLHEEADNERVAGRAINNHRKACDICTHETTADDKNMHWRDLAKFI